MLKITRILIASAVAWTICWAQPVTVRYAKGAANAEEFLNRGHVVKAMDVGGMAVFAKLYDDGSNIIADIEVNNISDRRADVRVRLCELEGTSKKVAALDPEEFIAKRERRARIAGAISAAADGANAGINNTQTSSGTVTNTTTGDRYDVTLRTNDPDAVARAQARARSRAAQMETGLALSAAAIRGSWLYDTTVMPKSLADGLLVFPREKNHGEVILRVPVGDVVYEFPFQFAGKSKKGE